MTFFSNKPFFHYEIKRKLVEHWNKYLSVKWDCVQKHFKLQNLKLGPRVVVSWLICWCAADLLLLLHTATIWTLTEVFKIICISWIEWYSCWRRESTGMWHCVIGWLFPSILKGQVTKSHSTTSVKTWIWIFNSDSLRSYITVAGTLSASVRVLGCWSFAFQNYVVFRSHILHNCLNPHCSFKLHNLLKCIPLWSNRCCNQVGCWVHSQCFKDITTNSNSLYSGY